MASVRPEVTVQWPVVDERSPSFRIATLEGTPSSVCSCPHCPWVRTASGCIAATAASGGNALPFRGAFKDGAIANQHQQMV